MVFGAEDRRIVRDLAKRVAEIASHPQQAQLREMWKRHNRLDSVKPMVLAFPEGAWSEMLPHSVLECKDENARGFEWSLRSVIYRWEHLRDDYVIEPWVKIGLVWKTTGWGLEPATSPAPVEKGAWAFDPPMKQESDIEKLRLPDLEIDEEATQRNFEVISDAVGDILEVKIHRRISEWTYTCIANTLAHLRGLDQMMLDMVERPEWLNEVIDFLVTGMERLVEQAEAYDKLSLVNTDDYISSGGLAYTDELPAPGFDGRVRLRDLWGFAEAQELVGVSPEMHEDFVLRHQRRILEHFGLNCYGCCEPVTDRLEYVLRIPRLRRISISPWADVRIAAEGLQDKYIFSWKPNPAQLCGHFDPEYVRRSIRETLEIARGCVLEMIMKDTHTVDNEPERLSTWVRIAQEETGGVY